MAPMALGVQTPQINGVQNFNASQANATAQAGEQQAQKRAAYQALAENALGLMGGRLDGEVNMEHFGQFKQMLADSGNPLGEKLTPELVPVIARGSLAVMQAGQDQARLDLAEKQFQLELDKFNTPVAPDAPKIETVFDEKTGRETKVQWNGSEWAPVGGVEAPDGGNAPPSDIRVYEYYAEQEKAAGREPLPYIGFQQALKAQGLSVTTNPDGTVSITQGGAQKPLTEAQSKDTVFATRAKGALPILDEFGIALTNPIERAVEGDPTGILRGTQSPEFQQAQQASLEFLQAILRKDTGAAITKEETAEYGKVYLPQPGDGPEVLKQKAESRDRAIDAIEAGLPPQAILKSEEALKKGDAKEPGVPEEAEETKSFQGKTYYRVGGDWFEVD